MSIKKTKPVQSHVYVFLLPNDDANAMKDFDFQTVFPNVSYMKGYLAGTCFGKGKLMTLNAFQNKFNMPQATHDYKIIFMYESENLYTIEDDDYNYFSLIQ